MPEDIKKNFGYKLGKFVKQNPKIVKGLILATLLLWGYGKYDDWALEQRAKEQTLATSLGFESVDEMKSLKDKGFNTKADFNNAEAKKIGFENYEEMKKSSSQGIKTGEELAKAKAKAKLLEFESVDEMIDLQSKGFKNKSEKIAKDKANEAERLVQEKARLVDAEYLKKTYGIAASVECQSEIERLAKYNYEWFDEWYETKFPSCITEVFTPGVLTIVGDRIKFQNGFGGWQIMSYRCEYDTQAKKVVNASAQPR